MKAIWCMKTIRHANPLSRSMSSSMLFLGDTSPAALLIFLSISLAASLSISFLSITLLLSLITVLF